MLASPDGENITLESLSTMDDKEVKTLCVNQAEADRGHTCQHERRLQ